MKPIRKMAPSTAQNLLPSVPLFESPFFDASWESEIGAQAYSVALSLRRDGYALVDIHESHFRALAATIIEQLEPHFQWDAWRASGATSMRLQDAWKICSEVGELACLKSVTDLLARVYGRTMFPFQTLNFACGSQQHLHSDAVHFNTLPDGWMCGVWIALEDVDDDNGPLVYAPGSQAWRFIQNLDIGLTADEGQSHQSRFHKLWHAIVENSGRPFEKFLAKTGQALIWSAHLLHGGDKHRVLQRTRWSQVTHFYGHGCLYLTPMFSNLGVGPLAVRTPIDISVGTPVANTYLGRTVDTEQLRTLSAIDVDRVTFDPESYLRLNPDVAAAGVDPLAHYLDHGRFESRRVR